MRLSDYRAVGLAIGSRSKDIRKVKVFKSRSNSKVKGQKQWYPQKGLITCEISKALALTVQKLLPRLKFSKNG